MSHRSGRGDVVGVGDPRTRGGPHPPGPSRVKRLKTKRERDTAKFGRKVPGGERRGSGPPPRRLPPLWGGHPAVSPLLLPKTVVITQNRLCQHRGMFNREVKSVNVERLLSPGPGQDAAPRSQTPILGGPSSAPEGDPHPAEPPSPPEAPQSEGGEEVPPEPPAWELASRLCALLGRTPVFSGRDLASERRGAILATLLRRHRTLPDLSLLLAHRNRGPDAAPPGCWSPQTPEQELSRSAERGDFGEQNRSWDPTPPYHSTPGPLQTIVDRTPTYPARLGTPSPIFGCDGKERETPFSWSSGEEEDDRSAPLFQPRGDTPPSWGDPRRRGGPLPSSPPACTCGGPPFARSRPLPQPPPPFFGEDTSEGCSWSRRPPVAPPAFRPLAPRHRRAPRRSFAAPAAPRRPDLCRGALPDPRPPDSWSPEVSHRLGFAPPWPRCRHRRDPRRHGSHRPARPTGPPSPGACCWRPALEPGPPPETHRPRDRGDAPEPGRRRGLGEPGWLRVFPRPPPSCFTPRRGLERHGCPPPPSPEAWGCPCAGLR